MRAARPLSIPATVGLLCTVGLTLDRIGVFDPGLTLVITSAVWLGLSWARTGPPSPGARVAPLSAGAVASAASAAVAAVVFVLIHRRSSFIPISVNTDFGLNLRLADVIRTEDRLHGFRAQIDEMANYPWGAHLVAATIAAVTGLETARALWIVVCGAFMLLVSSAVDIGGSIRRAAGFRDDLGIGSVVTVGVALALGHYTLSSVTSSFFFAQYVALSLTLAAVARSIRDPDLSLAEICLMGAGLSLVYPSQAPPGLLALALLQFARPGSTVRTGGRRVAAVAVSAAIAGAFIVPAVIAERRPVLHVEGATAAISLRRLGGPLTVTLLAVGLVLAGPWIRRTRMRMNAPALVGGWALFLGALLLYGANAILEHPFDLTSRYNTIKNFYPVVYAAIPFAAVAGAWIGGILPRRWPRAIAVPLSGLVAAAAFLPSAREYLRSARPQVTAQEIAFMRRVATMVPPATIRFVDPSVAAYILAVGVAGYPKDKTDLAFLGPSPPAGFYDPEAHNLVVNHRASLPTAVADDLERYPVLAASGDMELRSRWEQVPGMPGVAILWSRGFGADRPLGVPSVGRSRRVQERGTILLRNLGTLPVNVELSGVGTAVRDACALETSFGEAIVGRVELRRSAAFSTTLPVPPGEHAVTLSCVAPLSRKRHPWVLSGARLSPGVGAPQIIATSDDAWGPANMPEAVWLTSRVSASIGTIVSTEVTHSGASISQDFATVTTAGRATSALLWVRSPAGSPTDVDLALWALCGTPASTAARATTSTTWTPIQVTLIPSESGCPSKVELYLRPPEGSGPATVEVSRLVAYVA